jgi:hypothetical protein
MGKNINKQFFWLFLAFIVFGVVLYDFMNKYIDELFILLLVLLGIIYKKANYFFKSVNTLFSISSLFFIFGFYIVYSLYIQSNQTPAIFLDATLQIKPYLAFMTTLLIAPALSDKQKIIIKKVLICCFAYCTTIIVYGIMSQSNIIDIQILFFGGPERFATCITILALSYLYVSKRAKKDVFWCIAMLCLGLFSARSKFVGFFAMFLFFMLAYRRVELKIKIKNIAILCLVFLIVFFVAQEKFYYYFVEGAKHDFARPVLYVTAIEILTTYIPFGSGLGSFATYASEQYYSPLYHEFHLDAIYELSPDFSGSYISDTFFPVLAEFGIVGVFLFLYFWYSILKKATFYKRRIVQKFVLEYLFILLIFSFFMIESVADSTFTHNRGVFMMILLGMCLTDLKRKVNFIKN